MKPYPRIGLSFALVRPFAVFGLLALSLLGCSGSAGDAVAVPPEPSEPPQTARAAAVQGSSTAEDGLIASPEHDWPQWRGPRRDGISTETGLAATWPADGPPLAWKVTNLGLGWSSPIIVGDRLYITGDIDDDLLLFAFDLHGKPQWQAKNGAAWTGPYQGSRACCVYSAGKIYNLNAHGRVACYDAAAGREIWSCNLRELFAAELMTWGFSECLLVDGPRLIVTPGGAKGLMAALDKETGKTVWTTAPLAGDIATYSAPILFRCVGRRILANCSSAHGFGVDADTGKLLWTVPLKNRYGTNIATPVYGQGRIFYVTPYTFGACYQLQPTASGVQAQKVWETTLDTCAGSVTLVDGLLYGSGYEKHRSWLCLDWRDGQKQFEFKGLKIGAAVFADGRFYCLDEDGNVGLLKPTPAQFEVIAKFRLMPQKARGAWAHPVLLHGMLYLRYHDTLWCYDVRKQ